MRYPTLIFAILLSATQLAIAGAGNDQPYNINVTNPYSNNVSWAQFCWNTHNQSDSLVMIGWKEDFIRQAYDPTLTTNHCVVVKNLQPSTQYNYSVASCTDPVGGKQCNITDTNWSSTPWPTTTPTFTTADSTSGPMAFSAFAFGPSYVYQGSGINVGISLLQKSGLLSNNYAMMVTEASIDGMSCLPGTGLGAGCGNTGVSLTMLCTNSREVVKPSTDNYPVGVWGSPPYSGNYYCWNNYFKEPGMEARIVVGTGTQFHPLTLGVHTLRLLFQLFDYTHNGIPIGDPVPLTYKFSVATPPQFTVTPPTVFPPIPNLVGATYTAGTAGTTLCEALKNNNQAGLYLNADLGADVSNYSPWDIYSYDGNRVFKETAERLDGVTGGTWQPDHQYTKGDIIVSGGFTQMVYSSGKSGDNPPTFNSQPGGYTPDWGLTWINAANKEYYTECSETIGMQYLNWAVNVAKWSDTQEWNIFPWGMYMDYLRQGDVLNENCDGGPTCSGLNAMANTRLGANILTYPAPGFNDENFTYTYYQNQTGLIRGLPYNTNLLLVNWLETGVQPTNELNKRVDLLIQTIAEAINYNPSGPGSAYICCFSTADWTIGPWAMSLISTYDVETYMNATPDARIPIELMKLLDWFYSTQFNLMGNDYAFPSQPWAVPYNCSIFSQNCGVSGSLGSLNGLVAPAYAWLGAVYGDSCKLPTSGVKCFDAADQLYSNAWGAYTYNAKNFNQLFQDFSNYVGWRSGTLPGTDSYVLPTHNPLGDPYPDIIGPYPSGAYPAKPTAGNITNSTATITWYTFEQAVSTVVMVGTDPNNINMATNCGPSVYTNNDNVWINTCKISGLSPNTLYYFGAGGTDAANNYAFSAVDPTNNLQGNYLNFTTTQ
ncbi:MAG: fibronectin type III domain-containing protein [Candidatus Korobacteraceae bacterium]